MMRALVAAALCLAGCGGASSVSAPVTPLAPVAARAAIWYHPEPSAATWPGAPSGMSGSLDFVSLFAANAP